ncbi:UNKNOWN [Stylonychia lemnae]|uniref:Uncharacterized protein n=1 Tax=Stylonychia lemnae TaxID=5949 RepID=A0A078AFV2_STYLE|nr:UNKNOWN [Stylonychia lemnae]|eukprot:CDW80716.1 UNKNOWN [Stylonychia lemnae]
MSTEISQFLNFQAIAAKVLLQTWEFLKCQICLNLAENPRRCQTCNIITCFECITNYQQNVAKDPSVCHKGCKFIMFFPLGPRDLIFNQYFKTLIGSLQFSEALLINQVGNQNKNTNKIDLINNGAGGFEHQVGKQANDPNFDPFRLQQIPIQDSNSFKQQQQLFEIIMINQLKQYEQSQIPSQQNQDQSSHSQLPPPSQVIVNEVCVLCLQTVPNHLRIQHIEECKNDYRFCEQCKLFKHKCDASHKCFLPFKKCPKCDIRYEPALQDKHQCLDEIKQMMLTMKQDFLNTIKKLQQENIEMKQRLRRKEDVNFCCGCDKLIIKTDKRVKCASCTQEFCYSCVGSRLFYCYICVGYVCCEEPKQAQLCDLHMTKSKDRFGQLFQSEALQLVTENPENVQLQSTSQSHHPGNSNVGSTNHTQNLSQRATNNNASVGGIFGNLETNYSNQQQQQQQQLFQQQQQQQSIGVAQNNNKKPSANNGKSPTTVVQKQNGKAGSNGSGKDNKKNGNQNHKSN